MRIYMEFFKQATGLEEFYVSMKDIVKTKISKNI